MIRIMTDIKNSSPFLQTVQGEIVISHLDFRKVDTDLQVQHLLKCNFSIKKNTTGFYHRNGVDNNLFELFKPQIDVMLNSYKSGMLLSKYDHSWVLDSCDMPLDEWLKMKGITHEISKD